MRRWRQYLLGRRFIIYTDHQNLRSLLHQTIQTPEQHKWLTKLLGFEFQILYKLGNCNRLANALSCIHEDPQIQLSTLAVSKPISALWGALLQAYKDDPSIQSLLEAIPINPDAHPGYSIRSNIILYHGQVLVHDNSALRQLLISEYHNTPVEGHAGIQHTLHRISSTFTWPSLKKHVQDFVNSCNNCQFVKSFSRAPQGPLQPLPIPGQVWDSVSMDFITHLPPSSGKTVILVVVDHLSKQAHFSALCTKFTAVQVADVFTRDAIRLHGVLTSVVSNRDPIFVSHFWQELFRLQGTQLLISSAYHHQTDGQIKILNRYLGGLFTLLRW